MKFSFIKKLKMLSLSFVRCSQLKKNSFSAVAFPSIWCSEKNVLQMRTMYQVPTTELHKKYDKKIGDENSGKSGVENLLRLCKHRTKSFCATQVNLTDRVSMGKSTIPVLQNHENKASLESPLVHYASKGVIFILQDTFLKERSKSDPKDSSLRGHPENVNEVNLLKDSHKTFSKLNKDKMDLEYFEEIGKEQSRVSPIIGEIPLNSLQWRSQKVDIKSLPKYYAGLAKSRLTGLVVLTAMAGYTIAPAPFDASVFLLCSLGTALVSSSANSINQFFEVPFDSQMDRTKNRVLVRGLLTPLHTVLFGVTCGCGGLFLLYYGVNGVTALLGGLNLLLYTSLYTPIKRISVINTWVGAFVGAIPPMMGWAGCTGSLEAGAWILGSILYAWQFPHFNALSWNLRQDYSRAGYRMMSVTNPGLCRRTALRYSASILILSTLAPICSVTTWTFAVDSLPFNLYFTYLAWRFYKDADSKSSRKLFQFSLLHLPAILILMIISKKSTSKTKEELNEAL